MIYSVGVVRVGKKMGIEENPVWSIDEPVTLEYY